MDGPKERQKQFAQERLTKLKPRDSENKKGDLKESSPKAEEAVRKKQTDAPDSNAIAGDHAEQMREYRKRQKDKRRGTARPRASNEEKRKPKKSQEDENGG